MASGCSPCVRNATLNPAGQRILSKRESYCGTPLLRPRRPPVSAWSCVPRVTDKALHGWTFSVSLMSPPAPSPLLTLRPACPQHRRQAPVCPLPLLGPVSSHACPEFTPLLLPSLGPRVLRPTLSTICKSSAPATSSHFIPNRYITCSFIMFISSAPPGM